MTSKKLAIKSISLLWLGTFAGAGCAFLTQVLLARELGPKNFGVFATVLSIVMLATPIAGFGIGNFWLKAFGDEGWSARRWFQASFKYTILTTLIISSILIAWAIFGPHNSSTTVLLLIMTTYLLGQLSVDLVSAKLQLEERYFYLAMWQFIPHLIRLMIVVFLINIVFDQLNINSVGYAYAVTSLCLFCIGVLIMWQIYHGKLDLKGHGSKPKSGFIKEKQYSIRDVLSNSWPFGLAGIFYLIYFQSDIIILKYLKGDEEAGIYNVAFIILAAIYIFPSVVYQKFLMPKIHRWAIHDQEKFYEIYRKGNLLMFAIGVLTMVAVVIFSPIMIKYIFGTAYDKSVIVLLILSIAIPARFIASSSGAALTTQSHIVNKIYIMATAAIINILLNILLIPNYGIIGAAVTTIFTEIFLAIIMYFYVNKKVFKN